MWVIKIGGSLCHKISLARWLDQVACFGPGQVVVVPGGGPFADEVRAAQGAWGVPDATAHRMALLAMDQFGELLLGLRPDLVAAANPLEVRWALANGRVPVWLAGRDATVDDLPATWEITSDSLAAFLAGQLGAGDLLLVKSVALAESSASAAELADRGWLDAGFPPFLAGAGFSAWLVEREDHEHLRDFLYAGVPLGACRILPAGEGGT
jgi:aspartokinase-like uncharacterized kinase